jgi:hypothetical protein
MGVWQGVAMDSLKFHPGLSCLTLICPAGVPPPGWSAPRVVGPQGGPPVAIFLPFAYPTPYAPGSFLFLLSLKWMKCRFHSCSFSIFYHQRQFFFKVFLRFTVGAHTEVVIIGIRRGVSKGVEDGHRLPALWVGHPLNRRKAVSGVARPQGAQV